LVSDANVQGRVSSSDLMAGYQKYFNGGRLTVYGGGNYDDYSLNKPDNASRVGGGKFGAKGQIELFLTPTKDLVINNISNYTSAYHSYWSQTYVGWNFGKLVAGPEVAFLGNTAFRQQRFGLNLSNIDIGLAKIYVAGGYMRSFGSIGDDGAYTSIGFSKQF
jgi:hypothetical protein